MSSLVICSQPKSETAAGPGRFAFQPRSARAHVSCAFASGSSMVFSNKQKTNRCLKALKARDFLMIKVVYKVTLYFAASRTVDHVRWLAIFRNVLSKYVNFSLLCIGNPK